MCERLTQRFRDRVRKYYYPAYGRRWVAMRVNRFVKLARVIMILTQRLNGGASIPGRGGQGLNGAFAHLH